MSDTPTPRTEEVLRKNAASEQTPQEDYEALAVHAEMLERELDFSEKTGRQIWQANERLQRELGIPTDAPDANTTAHARINWWKDRCDDLNEQIAAERELADRLAAKLQDIEESADDDELGSADFRKCCRYDIQEALAEWKGARNE